MLTGKQRSHLRRMANTIDPIVHIGKGGVSEAVISQTEEALDAKELVKCTVMRNVDDTTQNLCDEVAQKTGSEIVQVIGRKFVLYKRNEEDPQITV